MSHTAAVAGRVFQGDLRAVRRALWIKDQRRALRFQLAVQTDLLPVWLSEKIGITDASDTVVWQPATRRFVARAYSHAAFTTSSTFHLVLIGTSSLRSSSSGACRLSARVTGIDRSGRLGPWLLLVLKNGAIVAEQTVDFARRVTSR